MKDLIVGYTQNDTLRIKNHLRKLLNHVEVDKFILAGGIAIRYHAISNGLEYPIRESNDLDVLLTDVTGLKSSITDDFMLLHYHINDAKHRDRFYFVAVDPETKTIVDIFDEASLPAYPIVVDFEGMELQIRSLEDQFSTKIIDMSRVLEDAKVDNKWFSDTKLLRRIVDLDKANECWQKNLKMKFFQEDSLLHSLGDIASAWQKRNYSQSLTQDSKMC